MSASTKPTAEVSLWALEPGEFEVAVVERIRPSMQPIQPVEESEPPKCAGTDPPKCREKSTPPVCSGESKPPKCSNDTQPPQCRKQSSPPVCKGEVTEDPRCA